MAERAQTESLTISPPLPNGSRVYALLCVLPGGTGHVALLDGWTLGEAISAMREIVAGHDEQMRQLADG